MKKLLAAILIVSICLSACISLASCANRPPETTTGTSGTTEATETVGGSSESSDTTETSKNTDNTDTSNVSTEETDETTEDHGDSSTHETTDSHETVDTDTTETTESDTTEDTTKETTEDTTEETTEEQTVADNSTLYGNGAVIDAAGIEWESGFFSNVKHDIDASAAQNISAADLLAKMQIRDGEGSLKDGEVWRVSEALVLESGAKYYGNGAAIIAEGGIFIKDATDVAFKDVLVIGSLSIENSHDIAFYKLDINSSDITVVIDSASSNISFKTCRIYGDEAALTGRADGVTVFKSYIRAQGGISLSGDNVTVQDCKIIATVSAVDIAGTDCVVRENTVMVLSSGIGIKAVGTTNALIALNDIQGVQDSIIIEDGYNCSITMNRAISVHGNDCTNLYVVANSLGGYISLENNNYIICDGNTYSADGLNHSLLEASNANTNGNNIKDVSARVEVGANEDILPHTNKELFVGMDRKNTVTDASFTYAKSLGAYINDCGASSDVVIVPPGAYSTNGITSLRADLANTKIYAYGVYQEYSEQNYDNYVSNQLYIADTTDISVYGLTIGYAIPSSGQVRVVDKSNAGGVYTLTVIPDAGFWDGFTQTDPDLFHTWWPEMFLLDENGEYKYYCDENPKSSHTAVKNLDANGNYDGTITITLKGSGPYTHGEAKNAKSIWDRVEPGTILTCRLNGGNRLSVCISNSKNITLQDVTVYGYAAAFSAYANGVSSNVNFIRYHDTTHSSSLIDKETYDKYVALEDKWGVDFEVYEEVVNGEVRYRGAPSRSSSVDAFHVTGTTTGVNIISSIVESMVDDGSNQHSASSRLHSVVDNGDGTTTIYYKDTATGVNWGNIGNGGTLSLSSTANFGEGDRIYIYAPDGRTVCDAVTLSGFSYVESISGSLTVGGKTGHYTTRIFKVTVATSTVDFDALINPDTGVRYDLSDNHYNMTNKVSVDNITQNACNYTIDNMLVRNAHSRGFLIKSRDVTIKHCTFRNVSYSALLIRSETEWAESSIAKNILVQQCLFDHTGYIFNGVTDRNQACIRIEGTSTEVSDDTLPIDNITITGCKFTNNDQRLAIWINSAKNVTITNNTFDPIVDDFLPEQTGVAVLLDVCMNVEISDNTYNYKHYNNDITNVIKGYTKHANIFGSDVEDANGNPIFPDK
ncbi:MAG: hypothetical protein E7649_00735 [Ruminococcaceae bacterium]|nr:hypothetical protein [Oscillospiraceae bacterium]